MKTIDIPPINDPCWLMDSWRTERLLQMMEVRNLTSARLAELTGTSYWTVAGWRSNTQRPISKTMLRLVMFEFNYGALSW